MTRFLEGLKHLELSPLHKFMLELKTFSKDLTQDEDKLSRRKI